MKKYGKVIIGILLLAQVSLAVAGNADAKESVRYCGDSTFKQVIKEEIQSEEGLSANKGKRYYVSTSGKDSWKGTKKKPYRTISKAVKVLKPGDILYIRGGTYKEEVVIPDTVKGTKKGYITLRNYKDEKVVLDGAKKKSPVMLSVNGASYLRIQGLEIKNAKGKDACGIYVEPGTHHLIIRNNKIHDVKVSKPWEKDRCANGILFFGESKKQSIHDILLYKNNFYDCQTGWAECISVTGNCEAVNIISNKVRKTGNIGIDISGNYGYCSNPAKDFPRECLIYKNRVEKCVSSSATSYGIYVDGGQKIDIVKNTIQKCSGGIEIGAEEKPPKEKYSTSKILVSNNKITDNIENAITIGGYKKSLGWVKDVQVQKNVCQNNGLDNIILTLAKCKNVVIENNTFINESGGAALVYAEFSSKYTKEICFKNNTFYNGKSKKHANITYLGKKYPSFDEWKKVVGNNAGKYKSK